jgi:hypothetical protein
MLLKRRKKTPFAALRSCLLESNNINKESCQLWFLWHQKFMGATMMLMMMLAPDVSGNPLAQIDSL